MYYGDDVIITKKGIRIRPKALLPIGILDNSICWGIVVPHSPLKRSNLIEAHHMVISPFHPKQWHALFRLVIRLKDEKGAMSKITKILNEKYLNILYTQCASLGYNNSTWHLIGEALEKNEIVATNLEKIVKKFYADYDAFDDINKPFKKELTDKVAKEMFFYRYTLEQYIKEKAKRYLHKNLDWKKDEKDERGNLVTSYLYEIPFSEKDNKLKELEVSPTWNDILPHLPNAVEGRWLKELAFYRVYSQGITNGQGISKRTNLSNWESPIRFRYQDLMLRPFSETDKQKYLELIYQSATKIELEDNSAFPIKTTAAFNHLEHYVRVVVPQKDEKNKRVSIKINYKIDLDLDKSLKERIRKLINLFDDKRITLENFAQSINEIYSDSDSNLGYPKLETYFLSDTERLKKRDNESDINQIQENFQTIIKLLSEDNTTDNENKFLLKKQITANLLAQVYYKSVSSYNFLQKITEVLDGKGFNLKYVSNSISNSSLRTELGTVYLIGQPKELSHNLLQEVENTLSEMPEIRSFLSEDVFHRKGNKYYSSKTKNNNPKVEFYGAKSLFISTKFDFINNYKPNFREQLKELAQYYGFRAVLGDRQITQQPSDKLDRGQHIEVSITDRIKDSDAFLQILPKMSECSKKDDGQSFDYLLYELGVARGLEIPNEVCIDCRLLNDYAITAGKAMFLFDSFQDTSQILEIVEKAVKTLSKRCYDGR